ncbi:FecR domain-containing protein [Roseibium sp.]|uniref:FecR domain-containing protein n=1 Tax=Roseibium sp. TaxID=1936156 RepID=UPI003A984D97
MCRIIKARLTYSLSVCLVCVLSAHTAFAVPEVGVAAAVNTQAFGTAPGGARTTKVLGQNVFYNERIETSGSGLVQVLLIDGSTFTVGPNADMVIDEFVYDPEAGNGKLVVSFGKGVARFVGGKLSKNEGGVSVKTPVGTIGIRGGIANLSVSGDQGSFSLLFGEELTFTGPDGHRNRVYETGYTLNINQLGRSSVRRTTQADLGGVQDALSSRRGQQGGTPRPPSDNQVAGSRFPAANSGLGTINTTPPPKPQVVRSTPLKDTEYSLVQPQRLGPNRTRDELGGTVAYTSANVRIRRSGAVSALPGFAEAASSSSSGRGIFNVEETIVFKRGSVVSGNVKGVWSGTVGGKDVWMFERSPTWGYFSQSITDQNNALENFSQSYVPAVPVVNSSEVGNLVGNAQGMAVWGEQFAAFTYFPAVTAGTSPTFDYSDENVILGLYGVPTDFSSFGSAGSATTVRAYTLYGDALTAFQIGSSGSGGIYQPVLSNAYFINPLIAQSLGSTFMADVSSTGLLMLETSPTTLEGAKLLTSSFHISGTGNAQKSLISLGLGTVTSDDGKLGAEFGRRGGHRTSTGNSSASYSGSIETVEGADGGDFYGENAQNFVLSGSQGTNVYYSDSYITLPSGTTTSDLTSNTHHVASLSSESSVSGLSRTSRTLWGFSAGVLESSTNEANGTGLVVVSGATAPEDLKLTFDATTNSISARFWLFDSFDGVPANDPEVSSYEIRMGTNANGSGTDRSVFIDDDNYAAVEASDLSAFSLSADSEETVPHSSTTSPDAYLVPSTLVDDADDALFSGSTECTCAFLEWGYWGVKMEFEGTGSNGLTAGTRTDQVHLGTWVAGDPTPASELPATGSASYTGHAVGSVIDGAGTTATTYLAAGDFSMSVDFTARTASGTVSNFDGRTFTGAMNTFYDHGTPLHAFSGSVTGDGSMQGDMTATIVKGPQSNVQGIMGGFEVQDGTWAATGILAGENDAFVD